MSLSRLGNLGMDKPFLYALSCNMHIISALLSIGAVAEYRLFRKDHADGRKGGGVVIMGKDIIPAIHYTLPDVVTCDIGPPESCLIVICAYRPPRWRSPFCNTPLFTSMLEPSPTPI